MVSSLKATPPRRLHTFWLCAKGDSLPCAECFDVSSHLAHQSPVFSLCLYLLLHVRLSTPLITLSHSIDPLQRDEAPDHPRSPDRNAFPIVARHASIEVPMTSILISNNVTAVRVTTIALHLHSLAE